MAISFPVPLDLFFDGLPVEASSPELQETYETNQNGYGEILTADLGARLWKMEITIRPGSYDEMEPIRAKLNMLRQAGRTLFAHAIPRKFPRNDPTGAILDGASVTLATVNANQRDLTLGGLPGGFQVAEGDYLSFQYGSDPVRYAFHQVVRRVAQQIEVTPNIRPGYTIGAPVQLVRPYFKGIIVPNSTRLGNTGQTRTSGISFTLQQTLRN